MLGRAGSRRYRRRVLALASLGYAYVGGLVLLLGGGLIFSLVQSRDHITWLRLTAVLAVVLLLVVRCLLVRIPDPPGIPLDARESRVIRRLLDQLGERLTAPTVDDIHLVGDLNAAVSEHRGRRTLLVGLPLLQALDADELRAILGHELGHLSQRHGRGAVWVAKCRRRWARFLSAGHANRGLARFIFGRFFEWYVPTFERYAAALSRAQEFECDQMGAEVAGAHALGRALVKVSRADRFLANEFWPTILGFAATESQPPDSVYRPMASALAQVNASDVVEEARETRTDGTNESHPSLRERLAALSFPTLDSVVLVEGGQNAEIALLGDQAEALRARLDAAWRTEAGPWWRTENARRRGHSLATS